MKKNLKMFVICGILFAVIPLMADTETVNGYSWTYYVESDGAQICGATPELTGSVTIPSSLGGMPVTSFGEKAFRGCSGLTSVTIPNSVTNIGVGVFYNCSGLASVEIPDGVTNIGDDAFMFCSGLKSVTIPNYVASIGSRAFFGCSSLASVMIPESVTSIGYYAFYECNNVTNQIGRAHV